VSYDLNLFSNNGNYDYSYDWQSDNKVQFDVYGNPSNSDYDDFKFLIIKPVLGDVYLYAYWRNPNDTLPMFKNAIVDLSMSTSKDENGAYIEDINSYDSVLVNSYGTKDVFLKFRINDVYTFESDTSYRILIDNLYIEYMYHGVNFNSETYDCGEYIIFQTDEDDDLIYDYWRKDHVSITDGKVASYLVADELVAVPDNDSVASSYNEYSYYFFDTDEDHPITDLISVSYNYELINYDVKYSFDTYRFNAIQYWGDDYYDYNFFCYDGLFSSDSSSIKYPFGDHIANPNLYFSNYSYHYKSSSLQTSGSTTIEVERPLIDWFPLWAQQSISYSFDNIQDMSAVDDISDEDEYSNYKNFMTGDSVLDDDGNSYQWSFKVGDDTKRNWVDNGNSTYNIFVSPIYLSHVWIDSNCNEVSQTLITHLTYFNDLDYYSLDVLDTPKDTVSIEVETVHYDDLIDKIFTSTTSFIDSLKSLISNFQVILSVILLLVITIVVVTIVSKVRLFLLPGKVAKLKK